MDRSYPLLCRLCSAAKQKLGCPLWVRLVVGQTGYAPRRRDDRPAAGVAARARSLPAAVRRPWNKLPKTAGKLPENFGLTYRPGRFLFFVLAFYYS
jgi:hypothetical protein